MTAPSGDISGNKLAPVTFGIAGLGGLGSHAALALARMGAGRLILVDFDNVDETNLERQAYRCEHIGQAKSAVLADEIARVNPRVRVTAHNVRVTPENAAALFGGCDVVLECFDNPEAKRMLVETLAGAFPDVPIVAASGIAGFGDANLIRTRRVGRRLWIVGDGETEIGPGVRLSAARVMVAAGHQALVAARIVMGEEQDGEDKKCDP